MENSNLKKIIPSEMTPPLNPILVTDEEGLNKLADYLTRVSVFGIDTETNITPTFFARRIRTIQIGDKNEQYVVDLLKICGCSAALIAWQGEYGKNIPKDTLLHKLVLILNTALNSKKYLKVGTNLVFDYTVLRWCLGLLTWNLYDCMLAEKVRYAGYVDFFKSGFWALDDMVRRYCGLIISKEEQKSFDLCTDLTQSQIEYAALDSRLVLAIKAGQYPYLTNNNLMRAATIEFDAVPAFSDMHMNGLLIDREKWTGLVNEVIDAQTAIVSAMDDYFIPVVGEKGVPQHDLEGLEKAWRDSPSKTVDEKVERAVARKAYMDARKEVNEALKKVDTYEGRAAINYGSSTQLREAMLKMRVDGRKRFTPSQLEDTGDQTLKKMAEHYSWDVAKVFPSVDKKTGVRPPSKVAECGLIDLIRLYRETNKVLTTYGVCFLDKYVSTDTGRVHSNINQLGAATGRSSSSKPNVQNILRGKEWRHCFVARNGNVIVTLDYSGCELRILAELSGETVWIDAFNNGWDVHSVGAEIMFGAEWTAATEEGCAYYTKTEKHPDAHQKCKCKGHEELRTRAKNLNFGIAYGLGYKKFAEDCNMRRCECGHSKLKHNGTECVVFEGEGLAKTRVPCACQEFKQDEKGELDLELAKDILDNKYKSSFVDVIAYLDASGTQATTTMEARTMCGSRRGFKRPTWEDAKTGATTKHGRIPTQKEIRQYYKGMFGSIEREGKNTPIQGTNAYMIKLAMGCGFDPNGKPYLWHYHHSETWEGNVFLENMVHDELVNECPEAMGSEVSSVVGDCMTRAGGEFVKRMVMETEGKIEKHWSK